jgi:4-carboxymuconolactone decarboxylase
MEEQQMEPTLTISTAPSNQAETTKPAPRMVANADARAVTPALADYSDNVLFGDVWERAALPKRDRSIVTVTALIGGGHTLQMKNHMNRALDNGVKPRELTEIITHLAFYAGWPRAMSAVAVAKEVFAQRGVAPDQLADDPGGLLPVDEASEAKVAAILAERVGATVPALVRYTTSVLFGDVWRRANLAPRDRSLVTIAALIAAGQVDQLVSHMNRGMDNGLSETEISEVITHLAFYAGWPRAMSAVRVAKTVFESRTPLQGAAHRPSS